VWEDLSSQVRLQLEDELETRKAGTSPGAPGAGFESKPSGAASLFAEQPMGANERLVYNRLRHDEAVQLDELMEAMESELQSAEIFAALFELELSGKVKSLPGKNYLRTF
jgi:DNA processing protein